MKLKFAAAILAALLPAAADGAGTPEQLAAMQKLLACYDSAAKALAGAESKIATPQEMAAQAYDLCADTRAATRKAYGKDPAAEDSAMRSEEMTGILSLVYKHLAGY